MVHELIGIRNGRVDLSGVPDIKPELKVIQLPSRSTKNIIRMQGHQGEKLSKNNASLLFLHCLLIQLIGNCVVV